MTPRIALSLSIAALTFVAGGCTTEPEDAAAREARLRAPPAKVVGEPVNCLQTNRIRQTRVHDDYTIDFQMVDGRTYRNTLANRCPGLGFEERFAYASTTGQLCSVDTITVLYTTGSIPGPTCGLSQFVPVEVERKTD